MRSKTTPLVSETGGPRARLTDPVTSHRAADAADLEGSQAVVAAALELAGSRGFTDDEIAEASRLDYIVAMAGRRYSPSRLRTARAELVADGVVVDSGTLRTTAYGRDAKVWMLERFEEDEAA